MKLNKRTVHSLINELRSVIDYDLNIMDEEGVIISSTDKKRIGQFHEAARIIISNQLPSLLVNYDDEYSGCKEGTNVPLLVDNEIIGVVGITENVDETSKYANIIKKTAEILFKEYAALEKMTQLNEARMFFLNSWLNGEVTDISRIRRKLEQYGHRLSSSNASFQAVIVDNINGHDAARSFLREKIKSINAITTWDNSCGILIGMFPSGPEIKNYIAGVLRDMPDRDDYYFAIGDTVDSEDRLHQSYNHAFSLYQYTKTRSKALGVRYSGISEYDDHQLGILMNYIPEQRKRDYAAALFDGFDSITLKDIVPFILTYCQCSGSINMIADMLFIHKNTVQYKIRKVRDVTGLDLRVSRDMIRLYAAADWYLLTQE